jgi:hypothetical protein
MILPIFLTMARFFPSRKALCAEFLLAAKTLCCCWFFAASQSEGNSVEICVKLCDKTKRISKCGRANGLACTSCRLRAYHPLKGEGPAGYSSQNDQVNDGMDSGATKSPKISGLNVFQVVEKTGMCRHPPEGLTGVSTGSRLVRREDHAERPEVLP